MRNLITSLVYSRVRSTAVLSLLTSLILNSAAFADGTKQVSPTNSADGAALFIDPSSGAGNYRDVFTTASHQRLQFTIVDNVTENLYLGFHPRTFSNTSTTLVTNAYYRILDNTGAVVVAPTLIPTTGTGFISTWAQANAGPNIGGATPAGYAPLMFDPGANGNFSIEIYRSNDGGATMITTPQANAALTMPFFDMTVSTAANVQSPGRLWSRKWSFITCDITNANFPDVLTSSFTGDFYTYTPDGFVLRANFGTGFRPLGYQLAMNFTGPATSGTFTTDRQSINAVTSPALSNGYPVFLTNPDATAFPNGVPGNPAITSNIYGCPGAYFIPYYIDQAGDVAIFLDLNGTSGFQAGTSDLVLEAYGQTAGNQIMPWNGLDGLGAVVPANLSVAVTVTLFQGRTNLPMQDAELNSNGLSVTSIFPALGSRKLYWDDATLTNVGTCANNNENNTGAGTSVTNLMSGIVGPTHAWDGAGPGTGVPAPTGGGGSSTMATLCDDFGNVRCINTWFYAADYSTPVTNMVVPNCDLDGDGIGNASDLDDDNDGIPDLTECSSDPLLDHDSDGIPNYLDPQFPGFVDANNDGVNDVFDFDRDGVINSFDLDSDGDGISDVRESGQADSNNNSIIDGFADTNLNGLSDAVDPACTSPGTGQASANAGTTGTVNNPANATDASAATFASLTSNPAEYDLDFGSVLPAGTTITVSLASAVAGTSSGSLMSSIDDVTYGQTQAYSVTGTTATNVTYQLTSAARYVRVTVTTNNDTRLHIATYSLCNGTIGTAVVPTNTDGNGGANYLDIDSDNDGIVDIIEAQSTAGYVAPTGSDSDRDGIDNAYDVVSGFGGAGLTPVNTDGADTPDYIDLNSDNDLYTDAIEGWDTDGNGVANTTASGVDSDNDGLDNAYDVNDATINPTNGTTPGSYPNVNVPGTTEKDWRETFTPPTVTLSGTTSIAENAAGVATLTATLSFATTAATTVTLTYTGTATNGTDYVASSTTITIPAGSLTGTVTIDPTDDVIFEGSETVIADITSVTGGNGATENGTQTATVTITDNETAPTVTLSGTTSIAENAAGVSTLTATLSVATTTATTVTLTYTGTATNGTDYVASSTTITIPAGSLSGTVTIDPTDDVIFEGSETIIADITAVTGGNGATENGTQTATVTITDNEVAPTVTLSGTASIAENAPGVVTLTATLSVAASTATTVTLIYTGTATNGTDYVASSTTITIPAGSLSGTVTIDPTDDVIFEGPETVVADITNVTGGNGATENGTQTATVTITDNETAPTVTLTGTTSVAENSGTSVTLTATLSVATTTATTVTLTYTGTASGTDYNASSTTITIPAGSLTGTVTITPVDDIIFEGSETVIVDITNVTGGNGATENGTQTATVTITDNETTPTVTLTGTTSVAENSGTAVTLTATLSVATTTATTVTLTYTGTATSGTDYTASSTTITIPAGSLSGTVTVTPIDDAIYEGNETVIADITNVTGGNGATESGTQTATVTIVDNETPLTVSLSGTTTILENGGSSATITATLSGTASTATVVTLTYTGTATNGIDYTASSVTITIPAGSLTGTATVTPIADGLFEGSETVVIDITGVTGGNGAIENGTQTATVTIQDPGTAPTVTLTGTTSIAENAGTSVTLTATLSGTASATTTVTLTYTGTATNGTDYTASSVTINIPAGSLTGTVTITPTDDVIFEGNETVVADITSVTGGNGATENGTQTATVTIADNEVAPTVTLTGTTSIAENAPGVVTLTATLSVAASTATTVTLAYTGTASGTDYVASSITITIPAGSLSGTVTIDPTDDVIFEGTETVIADIISVTGGNGATENGTQTATVTITDNETAPTVTLTGTTSVVENAGTSIILTATLSVATTTATTVTLTYTGTATNGTDYNASSTTITIPAGSLSGTVTVTPIDDAIYEGNETVIADITSVTGGNGATESGTQTATVTIVENETVPSVTLTGTTSVAENSGTTVTLTATLSTPAATATTVTLTYTGTATNGTDYTASSTTITIPAGATTGTVTITPTDDIIFEGSETVIADITSVTGGNGATESGTQTATVTITDNETAPTVTLTGTTTVAENTGTAVTLTATLSVATTTATTVTLTYTGTAVGADYNSSSTTITIPAGSLTGTVTITPVDDIIYEGNETVIADITNVTGGNGATESGTQTATVTIIDNETVPTVSLTGTTTVAENSGTSVTLTATLSVATTTATTVTIAYTGTASGTDYNASSTTITIPAGSLTGTVTVTPVDDIIFEGDETVIADITNVTGGNGATENGTQTATVTIIENETAPTVTLTGTTTVAENSGTSVTLTASLSVATTIATTVTIAYTGTASGADYNASSTTITIPAGSLTGTVTITPVDDIIYEGNETVIADITNVTGGNGATESGTQTATVTIIDNETVPTVSLTGTTTVAENSGTAVTLTATLSVATTTATTVTVAYTGTATDLADYTSSSVTITIPAGSLTGTVTVTPVDDIIYEGNETVVVDITNVTGGNGATENGTQTATVTIIDNETAPTVTLTGTTTVAENSGTTVTLTATLSVATTTATTVTVSYSGTASFGADYSASSVTITIPAGSLTGTVTVTPTDDNISEGSETVVVDITAVTGGNGATENGTQTAIVTITDDEAIPTVTLSGTTTVMENAGTGVTVTATLSGPASTATTVTLAYSGTATTGADYSASSVTITIPAGATTGTVTITPIDDVTYEGNETVVIDITNVTGGNGATENGTQTATVTIIEDDNSIPVANPNTASTNEDTPVVIPTVNANDTDVDGTVVASTIDLDPSTPGQQTTFTNVYGTWSVDASGNVTFNPAANFNGTATVSYTINDNGGATSNVTTITVTVNPINDAPVANDNTTTIPEDGTATLTNILADDVDVDNTLLFSAIDLDPSTAGIQTSFTSPEGTWVLNTSNGNVVFTPNANYSGTAAIPYEICDGGTPNLCSTANLIVVVTPINDAPIVDNEFIAVPVNGSSNGDLTNGGDSDPDGTTLTVNTTPVVGPSNGGIVINTDGTYTYTPNTGYVGTDMVVVSVCDAGLPLPAICVNDTIFINVLPTVPPVANNDNATTPEDTPITFSVVSNDTDSDGTVNNATVDLDPSTAGIQTTFTSPEGTWTVDASGNVTFSPAADFNGTATITYTVNDNIGATSNIGNITVIVTPVNDAPIVDNDTNTIPEDGGPATGDLTDAGDSDPDGTTLTVTTTTVSGPSNGVIVINSDGTYSYTPNPNFFGNDTIVVQVCDAGTPLPADCTTDTLIITVTPINDAPASGNENVITETGTTLPNINVTGNNTDPDGDPLTVTAGGTSEQGGTVVVNPDGTITYTPPVGYIGMDTVVYTVCDTAVVPNCVQDTIFIDVQPLLDTDNDGIPNITDLDDDNDGILDTDETSTASNGGDTDGDGIPDSLDLDSDNDGIPDVIEAGGSDPDNDGIIGNGVVVDTDSDGVSDVVDADNGGTPLPVEDNDGDGHPDFQDQDSDNDGIPDVVEAGGVDANNDGEVDTFNDSNNDGLDDNDSVFNPIDSDNDGVEDYLDLDSDNDGIPDVVEGGNTDTNGDGTLDSFNDADGDGMDDNNSVSNPVDTDNDGVEDYLDLDSDNDGIPDVVEGGNTDANGDGMLDNFNDGNGDGLDDDDSVSNPVDTDNDGVEDYVDLDSDNDGIPDVVEGGNTDANGDGTLDNFNDGNGDGLDDDDTVSTPTDSDNDGNPDYTDLDSDNDGIDDVIEAGGTDADGDGMIDNFNDGNGDGLDDDDSVSDPVDTDNDGTPDYEDTDSDNDSVPDSDENDPDGDGNGPDDSDGDGIPDYQDGDDDNDGVPTIDESGNTGSGYNDCDDDGTPNYLDIDNCNTVVDGLVVPEAFSPNGDGTNDTFVIEGIENFPGNTLLIFNRWGYEVFSATDYDNSWGGTSTGQMNVGGDQLPTGTYYYILDTKSEEIGILKGYVYLKR